MDETTQPASAGMPPLCLPPALRKPRLRRWEASEYLRLVHGVEIAPATLAKWVTVGGGPKFNRINRTPLYPTVELDRWVAEKISASISSTSEE